MNFGVLAILLTACTEESYLSFGCQEVVSNPFDAGTPEWTAASDALTARMGSFEVEVKPTDGGSGLVDTWTFTGELESARRVDYSAGVGSCVDSALLGRVQLSVSVPGGFEASGDGLVYLIEGREPGLAYSLTLQSPPTGPYDWTPDCPTAGGGAILSYGLGGRDPMLTDGVVPNGTSEWGGMGASMENCSESLFLWRRIGP